MHLAPTRTAALRMAILLAAVALLDAAVAFFAPRPLPWCAIIPAFIPLFLPLALFAGKPQPQR